MADDLFAKLNELKKKDVDLDKEIEDLKRKKEEEKKKIIGDINDTIKELILAEQKNFVEKNSVASSIEDLVPENMSKSGGVEDFSIQNLDNNLYESIKSVTDKPYDLWNDAEKGLMETVSYQINKLKSVYSGDDLLVRTESILKKDYEDMYRL